MANVPGPALLYLLVFGAAAFVAALILVPTGEDERIKMRLGVSMQGVEAAQVSPLIHGLRPLYIVLLPCVSWIKAPRYRERVERKFVTGGMTGMMNSNEFLAYKLLMSVLMFFLFVVIFFKGLIGWNEPLWVDGLVLILGFFFPDSWLNGQVRGRQQKIRRAMPYVMDLLTLSVEAGLDFVQGVSKVCEKAKRSPLIDELSFFLREIQVGASRQQALRNLSWRVEMQEMRSFSALLIQADILGASVGPVLRAQADLIRTQRFQRAERQGAMAAQKILFPLIMCIMPAVFIVIFGPIVLNFIYGGGPIGLR
jgi:tight adherence protein C